MLPGPRKGPRQEERQPGARCIEIHSLGCAVSRRGVAAGSLGDRERARVRELGALPQLGGCDAAPGLPGRAAHRRLRRPWSAAAPGAAYS